MGRRNHVSARLDDHLDLKIEELSEILDTNRSATARLLIQNSINQLQDEKGNWVLPRQVHEQKEALDETGETDDEDSVPATP